MGKIVKLKKIVLLVSKYYYYLRGNTSDSNFSEL